MRRLEIGIHEQGSSHEKRSPTARRKSLPVSGSFAFGRMRKSHDSSASEMARASHTGTAASESVGVHCQTRSLGRWMMDWSEYGSCASGTRFLAGMAVMVLTVWAISSRCAMSGCSIAFCAPSCLMSIFV